MILLVVSIFFPLPSIAEPFRDHLSENLQLKCASLPYRTTFVDDRCYFAVLGEAVAGRNKSSVECSSIFTGAKVATDAPSTVLDAMMIDKSKFHTSSSSGSKHVMCSYGNEYKCDASETLLSYGRCVLRATKKMNFLDAKNFCEKLGMQLPAPANDLDNRIVREAVVKDPVWVDKSLARDNGFKWRQGKTYSRFTTCDRPTGDNPRLLAGHQYRLRTCTKDTATVIDKTGYWSTGGVEFLMDVVCVKNAENIFTNGASPCKYHEANVEEYPPVTGSTIHTKTCYPSTRTTKKYEILGKATVETRRSCELLCDSEATCIGISFKDAASCIMLSSGTNEICSAPTTIFLKTTSGCVARTNLTAEFGVDPCIDTMVPSAFRGLRNGRGVTICENSKENMYITRAIDACGRRITIDNDWHNWIETAGHMWQFRRHDGDREWDVTIPIVAASCVRAGGQKCPCKTPLRRLPGLVSSVYAPIPDRQSPCNSPGSQLWWDVARRPPYITWIYSSIAVFSCKAGHWMVWRDDVKYTWEVSGLACYK